MPSITKEHFSVCISIEQTSEHNLIRVRDNGVGIAPEMLEDIFRDFYTFGKNGSYGLGLPFCRKVMSAFGGRFAVRLNKVNGQNSY